jgi:hypothetical protein
MTVIDNATTSFSDITPGDCFAFGAHFYLKLKSGVRVDWSNNPANAIYLSNGEPIRFEDADKVIHLPKARIETE